ncbi:MAG: hypothetical protein M3464_02700 [Chloroflexota bacterium]|nr:hypothetical protein [Chloroflexota bacterium]
MEITIQYHAERGFEAPALAFARRLFAVHDEEITSLALVPRTEDDLAVYLNGRLVHSTSETGRLPKLADIDGPATTS